MPVRAALAVATLAISGLLTACGADPDITTEGDAPLATAPAGIDLSGVAFADLTADDAPTVDALDNVFKAKYVQVAAGSSVTFRNDGRNAHNLLPVVDGAFEPVEADAFEPGDEVTVTFEGPGDHAYYCSLHGTTSKGMVGAVRVSG